MHNVYGSLQQQASEPSFTNPQSLGLAVLRHFEKKQNEKPSDKGVQQTQSKMLPPLVKKMSPRNSTKKKPKVLSVFPFDKNSDIASQFSG